MANTFFSPGVYSKERDLSTVVSGFGMTTGALVGYSSKGSLGTKLITNKQQFLEEYGYPNIRESYFHYTALNFLENASSLYCIRVAGSAALYGGVNVRTGTSPLVPFSSGTSSNTSFNGNLQTGLFTIYGKDPGAWNNNIGIKITNVITNQSTEDPVYHYTFVIEVYYKEPRTGDEVFVESWRVSRQRKLDGYGKQLFLEDRINGFSNYIVVRNNSALADTLVPNALNSVYYLTQGVSSDPANSDEVSASMFQSVWQSFASTENIEIQLLLDAGYTPYMSATDISNIQKTMISLAESRKDCFAILSVPYSVANSVSNTITYRDNTLAANSSYAAIYAPWIKINDQFSDRIVEVPPTGAVASRYVYTDTTREVWYAPAGYERGTLNVLGLTKVYTQGERDQLYNKGVNCLQTFRGYGHVVYGQKTLLKKSSALDRVNVRRLLIMIQKAVTETLRSFLFEQNDELTRFTVKALLDEYLLQLSNKGAFQTEAGDNGFLVVCDTTNNTPAVIDSNELHVDIFVKPSRTAEYIQLQMIVTRTGTSFAELISRGGLL